MVCTYYNFNISAQNSKKLWQKSHFYMANATTVPPFPYFLWNTDGLTVAKSPSVTAICFRYSYLLYLTVTLKWYILMVSNALYI